MKTNRFAVLGILFASVLAAETHLLNVPQPRFIQRMVNQSFTNGDVTSTCVMDGVPGDTWQITLAYEVRHDNGETELVNDVQQRAVNQWGRACVTTRLTDATFAKFDATASKLGVLPIVTLEMLK